MVILLVKELLFEGVARVEAATIDCSVSVGIRELCGNRVTLLRSRPIFPS